MVHYPFRLPDIGEGIAEAEIVAWHVAVGDEVEEDQPIADLMTDKATVEMTSPIAGTVVSLGGALGEKLAIGSTLITFETGEDVAEDVTPAAVPTPPSSHPRESGDPASSPVEVAEEKLDSRVHGNDEGTKVQASPAVRGRAKALGIDLAQVVPAQGDRVRHADLDAFLTYNRDFRPAAAGVRPDETIKVIGLRRKIAENMAASKRHIPHFSYVEEIDVTKLEALREDLNVTRGDKPRLTILPLLIVAICRALPDFPMINARYDDEAGEVTRHGAVHLGIATQTPGGLMVPVIRDAQERNIWQLASEIARVAEAARSGKASPGELSGSTLTLTSLGPLGGIATTPVINRPEVAIIGPNRVIERPVVRDGQITIAKLMNLSISCDHRVVDGWDAASFVQAVRRLIETPALLFAG